MVTVVPRWSFPPAAFYDHLAEVGYARPSILTLASRVRTVCRAAEGDVAKAAAIAARKSETIWAWNVYARWADLPLVPRPERPRAKRAKRPVAAGPLTSGPDGDMR
jgi:hypothetical protein